MAFIISPPDQSIGKLHFLSSSSYCRLRMVVPPPLPVLNASRACTSDTHVTCFLCLSCTCDAHLPVGPSASCSMCQEFRLPEARCSFGQMLEAQAQELGRGALVKDSCNATSCDCVHCVTLPMHAIATRFFSRS